MRKAATIAVLAFCLAGAGCAGLQALGNTAVQKAQVTLSQAHAGLEYLQATYESLKARGALPGLSDLRQDISDLTAVITKGDLVSAVSLYARARDRVTAIVAATKG